MAAPSIPPPEAEGLRLHGLLFTTDATAPWDFARAYLPHLAAWLRATNRVSADLCEAAAAEAVYSILSKPDRFDPTKGASLIAFLRMAATRDLQNLLRREERHAHEPLDENSVELHGADGKYEGTDDEERQAFLSRLRASLSEPDQNVLDLMLAGERKNEAFAKVVGVAHLPRKERDAEVKRAKDRIKARAKRMKDEP